MNEKLQDTVALAGIAVFWTAVFAATPAIIAAQKISNLGDAAVNRFENGPKRKK